MTYCVGIKLDAGLVFMSDSRTNAGLDQISTYRKMIVYEKPGDRFMVMLSAGNLSISQSVREILQVEKLDNGDQAPITIWNAKSMFDAVRVLGAAVRRVHKQDGAALAASYAALGADAVVWDGPVDDRLRHLVDCALPVVVRSADRAVDVPGVAAVLWRPPSLVGETIKKEIFQNWARQ